MPLSEIRDKDCVLVKPHEKISVEGLIVEDKSAIDESMLTEESIPVDKLEVDAVIGGSVNKEGSFIIEVETWVLFNTPYH